MEYPNTWREDRKTGGRRGSFQARRRAPRARLPSAQATRQADFARARAFTAVGARTVTRFIPYVGLALLAVELGWYYYQDQLTSGRLVPFAPPDGWTVGNLSCSADDGFNKQYHQGNPFCIGPFAHVTIDGPWGMQIPSAKNELHRLRRRTDTTGHTVAWWQRSGSPNDFPRGGYETSPAIPTSPIDPWTGFDPIDIPLHPVPQRIPDPNPYSPFPRHRPRRWRSPTERTFRGPEIPVPRPASPGAPRGPSQRPGEQPPARRLRRSERPADEITIRPRPGPVTSAPGSHDLNPPPPRTRERKGKTGSPTAFRIIRRIFEEAFEAVDYIDAIYEALPQHIRKFLERGKPRLNPAQKMAAIHNHYQVLDLKEVIVNLMLNEFEDFIFGRLGRASQLSAQRLGLSVGPQFGSGFIRAESRAIGSRLERQRLVDEYIQFVTAEWETFK